MNIANLILICYLLLSMALWSTYGLFSAFLNLLMTIVCGALALALWEPIVLGLLIDRMPYYAWAIGLIGPFVLLLIGLRAAQDRLVRTNMRFENFTSMIGGGFCGVLSGILTSGLVLIGLSLLPLGDSILQYQPIATTTQGALKGQAGSGLVFPVDRWSGAFFEKLSTGVFYPTGQTPMALYQPQVSRRAVLNRVHPDPDTAPAAHPGGVRVEGASVYERSELAELVGDDVDRSQALMLVSTIWNAASGEGTFDSDGGLRVSPAQMRLVTWPQSGRDGAVQLHAPEGVLADGGSGLLFHVPLPLRSQFEKLEISPILRAQFEMHQVKLSAHAVVSVEDDGWRIAGDGESYRVRVDGPALAVEGRTATATRFNDDRAVAYTQQRSNARIVWLFRLPHEREPKFIIVRNLRLALPESRNDETARHRYARYVRAFFAPPKGPDGEPAVADVQPQPTGIGVATGGRIHHGGAVGDRIERTARLPKPVNKHQVLQHALRGNEIYDGDAPIAPSRAGLSQKTRVDNLFTSPDAYMVRVHMHPDQAHSLFGRARQFAQGVSTFYLQDDTGQSHHAIAYVQLRKDDDVQQVKVDRSGSMQRITQLPIRAMRKGDELYIYFAIPSHVGIRKLVVGQAEQAITGIGPGGGG